MKSPPITAAGAVRESCRDWTARQSPDPIASAALAALAQAPTERTAAILLDQYGGAWRRAMDEIDRLLAAGDRQAAAARVAVLQSRVPLGRHLTEPWRVVLAGAPNAGKSSLINALVGYGRAIVHAEPGTTRDVLTARTAVHGWPVELCDTAGLRESADPLERAGVEWARHTIGSADLVLALFDSTLPWSPADSAPAAALPEAIVVHAKCDLSGAALRTEKSRPWGIRTSVVTREGLDLLIDRIAARLVPDPPGPGEAVPFTPEQVRTVMRLNEETAPV